NVQASTSTSSGGGYINWSGSTTTSSSSSKTVVRADVATPVWSFYPEGGRLGNAPYDHEIEAIRARFSDKHWSLLQKKWHWAARWASRTSSSSVDTDDESTTNTTSSKSEDAGPGEKHARLGGANFLEEGEKVGELDLDSSFLEEDLFEQISGSAHPHSAFAQIFGGAQKNAEAAGAAPQGGPESSSQDAAASFAETQPKKKRKGMPRGFKLVASLEDGSHPFENA
ncbi:unnamed protein product, partial [Amoebophrya sp. A25]